jgi:hypothetical protein
MAKKIKIAKGTLSIIEANSDMMKPRKDGTYKIKFKKKKDKKKFKDNCIHWYIDKKLLPTITNQNVKPGYWQCVVCKDFIPIKPKTDEENHNINEAFKEQINQAMLYSVKLGGDDETTKLLLQLRKGVNKFDRHIQKNILKAMRKREQAQQKTKHSISDSFNMYGGFNYNGKN